jgi:hypothetical protein
MHDRVLYQDGASPHVVVPAGELTIGAGTGAGRHSEIETPLIGTGEKAVVTVRMK